MKKMEADWNYTVPQVFIFTSSVASNHLVFVIYFPHASAKNKKNTKLLLATFIAIRKNPLLAKASPFRRVVESRLATLSCFRKINNDNPS